MDVENGKDHKLERRIPLPPRQEPVWRVERQSSLLQERNTVRDFVLDPQAALGLLTLINDGHSFYREFQLTGRYKVKRGTLNASYVHSKAFGNLNDFNQFFGNDPVAVINPDSSPDDKS